MAKLRSKVEEVIEDVKEAVEEIVDDLVPVANAQEELEQEIANTTVLDKATDLVSEIFGLDKNYSVTKFESKGQKVKLELENRNFIVSVTVKDRYEYNLFNDYDGLE